jgi:hypothetical protein
MDITIDKENYSVVTTSYGFVTDDDGNIYPFEFVVTEIDGEGIVDVEINWDDDEPENVDEIEDEIKLMF